MVGSCDVKFPIRLEGLVFTHGQFSRYSTVVLVLASKGVGGNPLREISIWGVAFQGGGVEGNIPLSPLHARKFPCKGQRKFPSNLSVVCFLDSDDSGMRLAFHLKVCMVWSSFLSLQLRARVIPWSHLPHGSAKNRLAHLRVWKSRSHRYAQPYFFWRWGIVLSRKFWHCCSVSCTVDLNSWLLKWGSTVQCESLVTLVQSVWIGSLKRTFRSRHQGLLAACCRCFGMPNPLSRRHFTKCSQFFALGSSASVMKRWSRHFEWRERIFSTRLLSKTCACVSPETKRLFLPFFQALKSEKKSTKHLKTFTRYSKGSRKRSKGPFLLAFLVHFLLFYCKLL